MSVGGYKGISYPFRVGLQGGAVLTTTSRDDCTHINESIRQILTTHEGERVMEHSIYCDIESLLFEPNDESLQALLKDTIVEALEELEERIEIENPEEDVQFDVVVEGDNEYLFCYINYMVTKYETYYTASVKLGEVGAL